MGGRTQVAELPLSADERAEASAMLADGKSTSAVCAWFGCDWNQLQRELRMPRIGPTKRKAMARLAKSSCTSRDLQDVTGETGAYVARSMAEMISRGLVVNREAHRGRGHPALYAITDAGREWLKEVG